MPSGWIIWLRISIIWDASAGEISFNSANAALTFVSERDVTHTIAPSLARDLETLENFGIEPTDNVSEEIELLADKLFSRGVEDHGDLRVIEETGLPVFVAGIRVDDVPVGFIQGAKTGKVGFIDYVGLYREGQEYLSPIGFRRVGKQLAELIGVKQFAGQRVTGARKEAQRKTDKFLDPTAISKLNYEVMYKMLEGEVEKLILENQGNPLIDNFKQKIVNKFSYLIEKLSS